MPIENVLYKFITITITITISWQGTMAFDMKETEKTDILETDAAHVGDTGKVDYEQKIMVVSLLHCLTVPSESA